MVITGAAGGIGCELCRQIQTAGAKAIVIFGGILMVSSGYSPIDPARNKLLLADRMLLRKLLP